MGRKTLAVLSTLVIVSSCTGTVTDDHIDHGRLVILDAVGNIVVMAPDGSNAKTLVEDPGDSIAFGQPIWSPDGENIAFSQVDESGFAVGMVDVDTAEMETISTPNLPFYMYWSPDSSTLAILHNGAVGVAMQMIDVADGSATAVDEDAPLYFTWAPDSSHVVTHAGQDRVQEITPDGQTTSLAPTSSAYLAPQWTNAGVFHVVDQELVVEDDSGSRTTVAEIPGPLTTFVANRAATKVALQTAGIADEGELTISLTQVVDPPSGQLAIIDVDSGEFETVTDELAIGFFWNPDGDALMVLGLTAEGTGVTSEVWTANGVTPYATYLPAASIVRDVLPFFPQYAQSTSFWSPDSTSFAFAGAMGDSRGIWVQDLGGDEPHLVSEGTWVAWSPAG